MNNDPVIADLLAQVQSLTSEHEHIRMTADIESVVRLLRYDFPPQDSTVDQLWAEISKRDNHIDRLVANIEGAKQLIIDFALEKQRLVDLLDIANGDLELSAELLAKFGESI
jgi:hypothetical protein